MGQKTHPKGFRLITTQKHLSNWYSSKNSYSKLVKEDYLIRETISKQFKELLSIAEIEISRIPKEIDNSESVIITIHSLYPRAKEMYKKLSTLLTKEKVLKEQGITLSKLNVKKLTTYFLQRLTRQWIKSFQKNFKKQCIIKFKFIKNPFSNAVLIAKYIANQLEKRVSFQRVIKQVIKKVQLASIPGIKIQISGRLNGAEMARTEWRREGKVPLHTLRANMDYTHQIAETIDGVLGIKVWLFHS